MFLFGSVLVLFWVVLCKALSALRMDGRLVLRLGLKHYLNELQDGQIMQLSRDALVKERATYNAFDTFCTISHAVLRW